MDVLIIVLIIVVAILLVLAVLVQNSKGGGLAAGMGSTNNQFGVKKTSDFLEKLTWGLAISLVVLCLGANLIVSAPDEEESNSPNVERAIESSKASKMLPGAPAEEAVPSPAPVAPEAPAEPAPVDAK